MNNMQMIERLFEIQWKLKYSGELTVTMGDNIIRFASRWSIGSGFVYSMEFSLDQVRHGNIDLPELFISKANDCIERQLRTLKDDQQ